MTVREPIARVWRADWLLWWAELWLPRTAASAPEPAKPIVRGKPAPIPGYERAGLHPEHDPPYTEVVS